MKTQRYIEQLVTATCLNINMWKQVCLNYSMRLS